MNPANARHKYFSIQYPVSDQEVLAYLQGTLTLAAPLISQAGLGYAVALDIDHGGEAALRRVLTLTRWQGLSAFALTSQSGDHDGGHVWLLFAEPASPIRLRALANELAMDCEVAAETYPTRKTIRLPLGIHRGNGQRGRVIFQDDHTLDLDGDLQNVVTAIASISELPRNAVKLLPILPEPKPARPQSRSVIQLNGDQIQAYNQRIDLIAMLEGYGGHIAQRLMDGGALMHCPCSHHAHGDQRPSLVVRPARVIRYGRYVAYGYAPDCVFYHENGKVFDAFSAYCLMSNATPREALQQLRSK